MSVHTLFKNRRGAVNVAAKDGFLFKFAQGRYFTNDVDHEKELEAMAKKGEAGVYIDPKEAEIDTEAMSPQAILKKQVREELLREMNMPASNNTSNYTQRPLSESVTSTEGTAKGPNTPSTPAATTKVEGGGAKVPASLEQSKKGTDTSTSTSDKK